LVGLRARKGNKMETARLKLTKRQQEVMDMAISDPDRRAEYETGYIPVNATWDDWTEELAGRDAYEPAERAMWKRLRSRFLEMYKSVESQ
jgi:hypothetical protein